MQTLVYIAISLSSFFLVIVPVSGGSLVRPLLALIVEPHIAVSIAVAFFFVNSTIKAFVFRNFIKYEYIKGILPLSIVGSVFGALTISYIPSEFLLILIFILSLYFLLKTVYRIVFKPEKKNMINTYVLSVMSLASGFLQGTGLGSGGELRKMYLLSEKLSLQEVNGTASAISMWILLSAVIVRLSTNQITFQALQPIIFLIPIMILANVLGRTILKRVNQKTADYIILIAVTVITVVFAFKIF